MRRLLLPHHAPTPALLCQISALHVESALLEHPLLAEVAVLGLPDEVYGEVGGQARIATPLKGSGAGRQLGVSTSRNVPLKFVLSETACGRLAGAERQPHACAALVRRCHAAGARPGRSAAAWACVTPQRLGHPNPAFPGAARALTRGHHTPLLQRIAAVVAPRDGSAPTLHELRAFASASLPAYQLPAELVVVPSIPRNAMGKVNKKELRRQLFPAD